MNGYGLTATDAHAFAPVADTVDQRHWLDFNPASNDARLSITKDAEENLRLAA